MSESDLVNTSQLSTKLEAILYLKAQPLSIQELADYAICEIEDVEEALLILMQDYALRDSALEVVETNAGFSLQLREAYMSLVQTIVPTDLGVGALRTLAAIALKGPIPQTQLVELRGSGAYQHVGDLAEEGFVSKRRQSNGRSYSVQVTEKFYQYFEVDELPKLKLKNSAKRRRVVESDSEVVADSESNAELESPEISSPNETPETDDQASSSSISDNASNISQPEEAPLTNDQATEQEIGIEVTETEDAPIPVDNEVSESEDAPIPIDNEVSETEDSPIPVDNEGTSPKISSESVEIENEVSDTERLPDSTETQSGDDSTHEPPLAPE